MSLLEVQGLRTHFRTDEGEFAAVDGISFSVEAGRTLAIVGESGCGKSVTSLSIMGLVPNPPGRIAGGSIRFEGRELVAGTSICSMACVSTNPSMHTMTGMDTASAKRNANTCRSAAA